jgi:hypothetical protein
VNLVSHIHINGLNTLYRMKRCSFEADMIKGPSGMVSCIKLHNQAFCKLQLIYPHN